MAVLEQHSWKFISRHFSDMVEETIAAEAAKTTMAVAWPGPEAILIEYGGGDGGGRGDDGGGGDDGGAHWRRGAPNGIIVD